ncbi:hypothetical protein [Methylotuvimicrobium sp. KM1]|uniref:hypothetical protein n=1 Tax=Methylotuvimicrobium sp. KM1 TaxID=3377707 RepID=UPI00384FF861
MKTVSPEWIVKMETIEAREGGVTGFFVRVSFKASAKHFWLTVASWVKILVFKIAIIKTGKLVNVDLL